MMLEFNRVLVTPYTELLDTPQGLSYHRGGPDWPDWDDQTVARHRLGGLTVDARPRIEDPKAELAGPLAWGGPIVWHFGHQVGDFSMRLMPTLSAWPDAEIAFSSHPRLEIRSLDSAPPVFREILDWFGVRPRRVHFINEPTRVESLLVAPQAEQLNRPNARSPHPEVGPSEGHLDLMDALTQTRIGAPERHGYTYVSRAGQHARFAGEAYLEEALANAGATVIRPEAMPLASQLSAYASAEHLLFAEGSAVHATKLLGRSLGDVAVLVRRSGARFAERSLAPRGTMLAYLDGTVGLVCARHVAGVPADDRGLSILGEERLLAALTAFGIDLAARWDSRAFETARDTDVMRWLSAELQSPRGRAPGTRDAILSTLTYSGLTHLSDRAGAYIDSVTPHAVARVTATALAVPVPDPATATVPARPAQPAATAPWSSRRINRLVAALRADSYLEIGVQRGETFWAVQAAHRTGVDPAFHFDAAGVNEPGVSLREVTSDRFFAEQSPRRVYDLIYIDGLHTFEQVYRDLCNAVLHTHPRTVMLFDDTWPSDVYSSLPVQSRAVAMRAATGSDDQSWHGDVFKVVFAIHDFHPGLNYRTIVGSGNPQTLVWRSPLGGGEPRFGSLEQISRLGYFDFLDHFDLLHPCSEDEAIETCIEELERFSPVG